MKVLVLHNNNLPEFLLRSAKLEDVNVKSISVALPETDVPDFDSHISQKMVDEYGANLIKECYDIIILPYNTTENDLEYTGLRILAHLRVTREWNCMATPIMFLGPDTLLEVNQFCELGGLLNTFNVFTSSITKQEDLITKLRWIKKETRAIESIETTPEYKAFLKRMRSLSAPANYTSHHSLANEWAIMRWNDMMSQPVDLPDNGFTHMLYYKYLRALYGDSQKMKRWLNKNNYTDLERFDGIIGNKKLVLIDDEWDKGWAGILKHIADSSGFDFNYCEIKKEWDRNTLIKEVLVFIDKNDADCFLLDLRLHDTDFNEQYLKENELRLSGYEILDYIKEKNEANQVVIFSASNKVWNFKNTVWDYKVGLKARDGATDYLLKETPESVLKSRESYNLYLNFFNSIQTSFKLSELKKVVEKQVYLKHICSVVSPLDEFYRLVLLDKGRDKKSILKACLMCLMSFLEDYIKDRFELLKTGKDSSERIKLVKTQKYGGATIEENVEKHIFVRREKKDTKYYNIIDSYYTKEETESRNLFTSVSEGDIGLLISALYINYEMSNLYMNDFFLPIKNKRNTISHKPDNIPLRYNELYNFYFKIIVPVIEHDYKK